MEKMKQKKGIELPKPDFEYPSFRNLKAYYEFTGTNPTKKEAIEIVKNSLKWIKYRKDYYEEKSELEKILTEIEGFPKINFTKMNERIQECFNESLEYANTEDIEQLQKITQIVPEISQKSMDKGYLRALGIRSKKEFSGYNYENAYKIKKLCKRYPTKKVSKQIFIHALVKENRVFNHKSPSEFYDIMSYIKYKPTKEIMQKIYDHKIKNSVKRIPHFGDQVKKNISEEIRAISSISKVKPLFSPMAIQEAYNDILKNVKSEINLGNGNYLSTRLEEIYEITHQKPNWNKETVQEVYNKGLEKEIKLSQNLYQITGIKPEFSNNKVQKKYEYYLNFFDVCEEEIKILRDTFGFKIPEKIIQETYKNFLKNGEYQNIKPFQKFIKIKPYFGENLTK